MDIKAQLATEFHLNPEYATNIANLLTEGNTIPFIARYRKEMHGGCDDQVIREFAERMQYLENLEKRKAEIRASIEEQGKWTDELAKALDLAKTLTETEDIYRPYKQKKKTRASVAIERGLEPLADRILLQEDKTCDLIALAQEFVSEEKGVATPKDALDGARDIIAERISDDAELRKELRAYLRDTAKLTCRLIEDADAEKKLVYETYKEFAEPVKTVPPHRVLALNRGEKEECLKVKIEADAETANALILKKFLKKSAFDSIITEASSDGYDRLIFPSVEREVRAELTDAANEQAIKMFDVNLRPLLMQPPLKNKVIIGLDPGYRTGCKVAVIDSSGNVLDHNVIYPTHNNRVDEAKRIVKGLIEKHKADVISIGNGTASKETEIFVSELLKEVSRPVTYAIVNEAGASVYSASKQGAEEFPEYDLTIRSAISIARRLLDPLAELIKIDVKSIGVGQYQHDMPQKRLAEVLDGVVEDCVNSVGVDLNTASYSLLARVAGLNTGVAKNIVEYRKTKPFSRREELLKVSKLGPKAYEQCAGFLRIAGGDNVLDSTAVHPETYPAAEALLRKFGYRDSDVREGKLRLAEQLKESDENSVAAEIGVGVPTLRDMVSELSKPGRDVRDELPPPVLRAEIMDIGDLKPGMELAGVVRNVIDFGAFVDIGVHQDGLVHISRMSDRFVKHPSEVVKVGDAVKVWVFEVDTTKHRIALTMLDPAAPVAERAPKNDNRGENRNDNRNNGRKDFGNRNFGDRGNRSFPDNRASQPAREPEPKDMDAMLKALQAKFNGK